MRLTLLEWSAKDERYRSITLNVTKGMLRETGKVRQYVDPDTTYNADKSNRRKTGGSKSWRQDKHKFWIDRPNGKPLRIRWWTYRAIVALLSHGHEVACLKHVLACTTLRHTDGSYAGSVETRGVVQTPAGYVVVGRPRWVDSMLEGWDDRPDGGTHYQPSTMDALRSIGPRHMRWSDVDVYARTDGSGARFTVTLNGSVVLKDATQDTARRWAAANDCYVDQSNDWWSRIEAEDQARAYAQH